MFLKPAHLKLSVAAIASVMLIVILGWDNAYAHSDDVATDGTVGAATTVGLEERLGNRISRELVFRDEEGKAVRLSDLITGPTIILPVFYSCTNVCNFLQGGLAKVLPLVRFKPGEDYQVLSVSFDENETPDIALKRKRMYLSAMNAPFPQRGWRFLTGDSQNIARLTDAAGFRFERKGRDFVHPVASIVVAGDGTIVRYLYGTNFLVKDVSLAILEAREGKIGTTVRTIVGFCFNFDPEKKSYVFNLLRVSATAVFLTAAGFLAFLVLGGKKRDKRKTGVS